MPELELLQRFAPPPTTPTPEARQAAREALLKRTRRRCFPRPALLLVPALAAVAAVLVWPDRESPVDERPATPRPAHSELAPTRPLTPGPIQLYGMRFTCARNPSINPANFSACSSESFTPPSMHHSIVGIRPVLS